MFGSIMKEEKKLKESEIWLRTLCFSKIIKTFG